MPEPVPVNSSPPAQPAAADVEHVACPVCKADRPMAVMRASERGSGVGGEFDIVRCGACGLLYTNPRPTAAVLGRFYPDDYYGGLEPERRSEEAGGGRGPGLRERIVLAALRQHFGYPGDSPGAGKDALTHPLPGGEGSEPPSPVGHPRIMADILSRPRIGERGLEPPSPVGVDADILSRGERGLAPSPQPSPSPPDDGRGSQRAGGWRKLLTLPVAWRVRRNRRHLFAMPWAGQGRLLDFGCGACGFLRLQRDRGWHVRGIDFSQSSARRGKELYGIDVAVGSWPGPMLADQTFDVITAWHVLEHIPDPPGWVRQAVRQLAPGGYLLAACPNSDSWAARFFGPHWFGLDVPRHFTHFTRDQLARLLTDAGLKVERIRYQVMSKTLRESAQRKAEATGSAWWRWLARQRLVWSAVGRVTGWRRSADSVVILARKKV